MLAVGVNELLRPIAKVDFLASIWVVFFSLLICELKNLDAVGMCCMRRPLLHNSRRRAPSLYALFYVAVGSE